MVATVVKYKHKGLLLKSTQMGPLLVLVSPCFRENVNVTCIIVSFLYSLDNFLLKMQLFSFLEIEFRNGAHLKKGLFLTYFSHFLVTREKTQTSFSTYPTYIHTYTYCCTPYWLFLPSQFCKNCEFIMYGFSMVWLLVLILVRAILEQTINNKMVSKI